jgi:PadR family transcriptional regulator PadR
MNGESPLGVFEEQVLLAVLHARDEAYGMNVRRELESRADREVTIGAVYATLDRLEAKGLVGSSRTVVDGVSRRVFRVTTVGRRALVETREQRERLWRGIEGVLLEGT